MLPNINVPRNSLLLAALLIGSSLSLFVSLEIARGAGEPRNSFEWNIQSVDAPSLFSYLGNPCLSIDGTNHPHLAYGGDHLYYASHDGTQWNVEMVDPSEGVGLYPTFRKLWCN